LREALTTRRQQVLNDVQGRIRDERASDSPGVRDVVDVSDAILQKDIDLALLQMRAGTLTRIDEALRRLDAGQYGRCFECARAISVARLRAQPFAVRCVECEQNLEDRGRARQSESRRQWMPFSPPAGF
jgi:DnaK suppressor protein